MAHQWMELLWAINPDYHWTKDGVYLKDYDVYEGKDRMILTWVEESPFLAFRKVISSE
jgi:hypothetical protein